MNRSVANETTILIYCFREIPFNMYQDAVPRDSTDLTQNYLGLALETYVKDFPFNHLAPCMESDQVTPRIKIYISSKYK